eukprot:m.118508 g.118508  ORF g.118508 m.118508 type:complete len:98 (+) comp37645_c0_seq2:5033-5326(+)
MFRRKGKFRPSTFFVSPQGSVLFLLRLCVSLATGIPRGFLSACDFPLVRLIMRRYDALSWLGMDLATGQRLSGLPFQLSAAEALAGEVDAVSQLGNE